MDLMKILCAFCATVNIAILYRGYKEYKLSKNSKSILIDDIENAMSNEGLDIIVRHRV